VKAGKKDRKKLKKAIDEAIAILDLPLPETESSCLSVFINSVQSPEPIMMTRRRDSCDYGLEHQSSMTPHLTPSLIESCYMQETSSLSK
jgi:hypothetical protein